jgi:hypothetical protein
LNWKFMAQHINSDCFNLYFHYTTISMYKITLYSQKCSDRNSVWRKCILIMKSLAYCCCESSCKTFCKCMIARIQIWVPFLEWVVTVIKVGYIFFNQIQCPSSFQSCYVESELQMTRPILECGFCQTMCLQAWQITDDSKWQIAFNLLISLLWPMLEATDICCCKELYADM